MKKVLSLVFLLLFSAGTVHADPYDAFNFVLGSPYISDSEAQQLLDNFAEDVGQAISGGSFGVGGNLGLMGINLSLKVSYQNVSDNNLIIRTAGDTTLVYPILQGEFGINEELAGILRLSHMHSSTVLGGGVRYRIMESYDEVIPTLFVQSVYNYLIADDGYNKFTAWNLKTSPMAFWTQVPFIQPYVFLSYDVAGVRAKSSERSGMTSTVNGLGYGFGGNLSLGGININASLSMYKGELNYNFGVFIGV
ncbi:MAG: hypothetical protein FWF00_02050 [Endomicrobia bacterium]|nr:hypothetical protein [Endomicrobiia bacterium]MCL2506458.1 hypothetical protein [Endomicrobiia bacterium]